MSLNSDITLSAVGDMMLGRSGLSQVDSSEIDRIFHGVESLLSQFDIRFGNLEMPLTDKNSRNPAKPADYPALKGSKGFGTVLKKAGFDVLTLANNHIMDYGEEGLNDTIEILRENSISYIGVGANEQEARQPLIITKKGITFGILAYSCAYMADSTNAGCASVYKHSQIINDIKNLKKKVDHVIVSTHRGLEYCDYPTPTHRKESMNMVDAGASLVLGHHPHVVQGIEEYKDGIICHSLGNFVFDLFDQGLYHKSLNESLVGKEGIQTFPVDDNRASESIIFTCVFDKHKISSYDIIPVVINNKYQPLLANSTQKEKILGRIKQISEDLMNNNLPIFKKLNEIDVSENIESAIKHDFWNILSRIHKIRLRHIVLFAKYLKISTTRIFN